MMNQVIAGWLTTVFLLGLGLSSANASVFARGGGESRTIASVSPQQVSNGTAQTVTLSGRFSSRQGSDRRVVISADRLPTPFPVRVVQWSRNQIRIVIPRSTQSGRYHVFLEKSHRDHGRQVWSAISNRMTLIVLSNEEAPLRVTHVPSEAQMCANKVQIGLSGGPFHNGIRVELSPPARFQTPTTRVMGQNTLSVMVSICWLQGSASNKKLRLIYSGGGRSDWVGIGASGSGDTHVRSAQPLRAQ
jgi:hypothetical protein